MGGTRHAPTTATGGIRTMSPRWNGGRYDAQSPSDRRSSVVDGRQADPTDEGRE